MRHDDLHAVQGCSDARYHRFHDQRLANRRNVNPEQGAVASVSRGPLYPTPSRVPASGHSSPDFAGEPRRAMQDAGSDGIERGRHGSKVLVYSDKCQG